jgi:hypothetical protein
MNLQSGDYCKNSSLQQKFHLAVSPLSQACSKMNFFASEKILTTKFRVQANDYNFWNFDLPILKKCRTAF